jgi:Tfp pilus assembly protein PilF
MGSCLYSLGRYADAQASFSRAALEKQQGDAHGRVDHESLGRSLHNVGSCASSQRQYAIARSWYQRAAQEKEQGDLQGRVDQASLQRTIDAVRECDTRDAGSTEAVDAR